MRALRAAAPHRASSSPATRTALTGVPGLPLVINPYIDSYGDARPVAARSGPAAGSYDIVFDTPAAAGGRPFTFRFWIDDVTPPTVRLVSASARRGGNLRAGGDRRRVRRRSAVARPRRSTASRRTSPTRAAARSSACARRRPRTAHARLHRGRLPGAEEHGERAADPPEHAHVQGRVPRQVVASARGVVLFDRRQPLEVALHAGGELVALGLQQPELRLLARARALTGGPGSRPGRRAAATPQPSSTTTAAASKAMKSQLTSVILDSRAKAVANGVGYAVACGAPARAT